MGSKWGYRICSILVLIEGYIAAWLWAENSQPSPKIFFLALYLPPEHFLLNLFSECATHWSQPSLPLSVSQLGLQHTDRLWEIIIHVSLVVILLAASPVPSDESMIDVSTREPVSSGSSWFAKLTGVIGPWNGVQIGLRCPLRLSLILNLLYLTLCINFDVTVLDFVGVSVFSVIKVEIYLRVGQ